jgi:hypothetical protein
MILSGGASPQAASLTRGGFFAFNKVSKFDIVEEESASAGEP